MAAAASLITTAKFQRCHPVTSRHEGGWSDHWDDRGGQTMWGITQAVFTAWLARNGLPWRSVRTITKAEALRIYYEDYWNAVPCEKLFPGVDLATYDASVNSGVSRGRKWLLASLDKQNRHDRTVKAICAKRLGFVQSLTSWRSFGRGWTNRIADIQAKGVAWALAEMVGPAYVQQKLEDEAKAKAATAKQQTIGAVTSGTGSTGTMVAVDAASQPIPTASPIPADTIADQVVAQPAVLADWLMVGAIAFLTALAIYLFWRAYLNRQQASAYARQAEASHGA